MSNTHMMDLKAMGHKLTWVAIIWGKVYYFMKDHEGTLYLMKVKEDGTGDIL